MYNVALPPHLSLFSLKYEKISSLLRKEEGGNSQNEITVEHHQFGEWDYYGTSSATRNHPIFQHPGESKSSCN